MEPHEIEFTNGGWGEFATFVIHVKNGSDVPVYQ